MKEKKQIRSLKPMGCEYRDWTFNESITYYTDNKFFIQQEARTSGRNFFNVTTWKLRNKNSEENSLFVCQDKFLSTYLKHNTSL